MHDVSLPRLYLLRATYLLIAVGLGTLIWPGLVNPPADLEHMRGVVRSLLGAVGLLAAVGIRYPLQMLPLLLFELTWKTIWMAVFGIPGWVAGTLGPGMHETMFDAGIGLVIFPLVIPWRYVWITYVRRSGDRWRGDPAFGIEDRPAT